MATIRLSTPALTLAGILHVAMIVLGFVLWGQIDGGEKEMKDLALLVAVAGIFFPTLSLLNVNLYAISEIQ
jgi:hypothetical protein